MPKVKTLKSFSGAFGSFSSDSEVEFPEEHIEEYVRIGYIEFLEPEKEPENIENNEENVINNEENVINQEQADKKAGKNKNTTQK